jgi:hypothetical protein
MEGASDEGSERGGGREGGTEECGCALLMRARAYAARVSEGGRDGKEREREEGRPPSALRGGRRLEQKLPSARLSCRAIANKKKK